MFLKGGGFNSVTVSEEMVVNVPMGMFVKSGGGGVNVATGTFPSMKDGGGGQKQLKLFLASKEAKRVAMVLQRWAPREQSPRFQRRISLEIHLLTHVIRLGRPRVLAQLEEIVRPWGHKARIANAPTTPVARGHASIPFQKSQCLLPRRPQKIAIAKFFGAISLMKLTATTAAIT